MQVYWHDPTPGMESSKSSLVYRVKPVLTIKEDAKFVEVFESSGKSMVLKPSVMADLERYV